MNESICQIGIDNKKNVFVYYKGEKYSLGQIRYDGRTCLFHPTKDCTFLKEALIAIAEIMSKVSEMPSDEEIDGLFNDK